MNLIIKIKKKSMNQILIELGKELYQFLFISAILFNIYKFLQLGFSIYRNWKFGAEEKYVPYKYDSLLYWTTITLILTYII